MSGPAQIWSQTADLFAERLNRPFEGAALVLAYEEPLGRGEEPPPIGLAGRRVNCSSLG